ncbi:MAG: tetratricopeptide repeat protein [Hyphomicrobiales bacterium]|nr:tetratricopeptide repeat protein [Hyphomicrobiales bacterium]
MVVTVMVEGDIFREVEEDIRREQFARAWNKYGAYVLIAAALIVVGVAGYEAWRWRKATAMAENGEAFTRAAALGEAGKTEEMTAAMLKLVESDPRGYGVLARLRVAAAQVAKGEPAKAVAEYAAIADDAFLDKHLRDYARIQWALLQVDAAPEEEIRKRLDGMASAGAPWRHSAREILGLAAFRAGKIAESEQYFRDIREDAEAPLGIRQRAVTMLALMPKPTATPAGTTKETSRDETKTN